MSPDDVDIDAATLATVRENDEKLRDLQARIMESACDEEARLIREFVTCARRQLAIVTGVPGLEEHVKRMALVVEQAEKRHGT